jgi:hypothetical protein
MLKETLKSQLPKIKNLIYLSESGFYDSVNVELGDWDGRNNKLGMVILTITLTVYADEDFSSMISLLYDIETKIHQVLNKVSFNDEGKLVRPNEDETVTFTGGVLLHDLHFSTMEDGLLEVGVDCMFSKPY